MRFVIYGIFLSLWMGMWIWTYTCHIKGSCCQVVTLPADSDNVMLAPDREDVKFTWLKDDANFTRLDEEQVFSHSGIASQNAEIGPEGTIELNRNQGEDIQFIEHKRRKAE